MAEDEAKRGSSALRRRRLLAGVLIGVTTVVAPVVLFAAHNPWRYVYLIPWGQTLVVVTLIFCSIMLGVAVRLFVGRMRAVWIAGVVAALTVLACSVGYQILGSESFDEVYPGAKRTVVAVSPDGAFDLVEVDFVNWGAHYEIIRIRSRAGLTSREAAQDLACFGTTVGGLEPENNFLGARFLGEDKVEVRTEAGEWKTTFDARTLLATETLSRGCEE